jgi:hypothetical protein
LESSIIRQLHWTMEAGDHHPLERFLATNIGEMIAGISYNPELCL